MNLDNIKKEIDDKIRFWRNARKEACQKDDVFNQYLSTCYIDAFQQIRVTLYEESLKQDDDTIVGEDYIKLLNEYVKEKLKNDSRKSNL